MSQRTLILATHNPSKILEFKEILGDQWDVRTASQLQPRPEWIENGDTFEANARIKALAVANSEAVSGSCILGEDSGICIDAMNGQPGIYSGRYMEQEGGKDSCLNKILHQMKTVPDEKRTAHFISVLVFIDEQGQESVHQGICRGKIARSARGANGFAYDSLFIPDGHSNTMGEISSEEKNSLSHRKIAINTLIRDRNLR